MKIEPFLLKVIFQYPSNSFTIAMWLKGGTGEFKIGDMYQKNGNLYVSTLTYINRVNNLL